MVTAPAVRFPADERQSSLRVGAAEVRLQDGYRTDGRHRLKPEFGHNIGFQTPISMRSAWARSRTQHTALAGWCIAEEYAREMAPKRCRRFKTYVCVVELHGRHVVVSIAMTAWGSHGCGMGESWMSHG